MWIVHSGQKATLKKKQKETLKKEHKEYNAVFKLWMHL
jgi:hypothetical protein